MPLSRQTLRTHVSGLRAELGVDVAFEGLAMPLAGYHASFGHEIA